MSSVNRLSLLRIFRDVKRELLCAPPELTPKEIAFYQSQGFTRSKIWGRLRYDVICDYEGRCACCGRGSPDGVQLNVDHIFPRKTFPRFALTYANLQVLCEWCNQGKGNRKHTDWRFHTTVSVLCPNCQARMRPRSGKYGKFWGCSSYPACSGTLPFHKGAMRD